MVHIVHLLKYSQLKQRPNMNTDAAKKQPISRKSMLVNQGWKQTDQSAFTSIARGVGYVDQSGNLYAGKVVV